MITSRRPPEATERHPKGYCDPKIADDHGVSAVSVGTRADTNGGMANRPGRPRGNRDAAIKLPVKSELKVDLLKYCKARKLKPVDLFEQWVTRELANPSQPELNPEEGTAAA